MVKTIIDSILGRQEASPVTRCVGQFSKENTLARLIEVRDQFGSMELWIEVQQLMNGREWRSLGKLRADHLRHQMNVMQQAHEYMDKYRT